MGIIVIKWHYPGVIISLQCSTYNSSPIANAMKNSSGLWDLKIFVPTWPLKVLIDIVEIYGHDEICWAKYFFYHIHLFFWGGGRVGVFGWYIDALLDLWVGLSDTTFFLHGLSVLHIFQTTDRTIEIWIGLWPATMCNTVLFRIHHCVIYHIPPHLLKSVMYGQVLNSLWPSDSI